MTEQLKTEVLAALRQAPEFAEILDAECTITRLGGLTNLVHLVDTGTRQVIVRIPGSGTEAYIDRAVEAHNARVAAEAGVSAAVIFADAQTGLMISEAIPDIVTMTPELFNSRKGSPGRAGVALAQMHAAKESFKFRFELFDMIDEYLGILATKDVSLPEGYHEIVAASAPVKSALNAHPVTLAPCHCDPLCENFLDQPTPDGGGKMWIVDWEYSGMNDPMWDLGDLAVEGGFDAAQEGELLLAYFGRTPTPAELGRVVIYKALCDLLWTLWGLIQLAEGNPAEDFKAYAEGRFARCKTLMQSPEFAGHVAAVQAG